MSRNMLLSDFLGEANALATISVVETNIVCSKIELFIL